MAFPAGFDDLTQTVIDLVRLDATNDLTKVRDAINLAYFEACVECEILVSTGSAPLSSGVATYDLDTATQIARIKDLWFETLYTTRPPVQVSIDRILRARQSTQATVMDAGIQWYSLTGQNLLDLFPTPGAPNTMHFVYVGFPAVLTGTDVPQLPEPYASNVLTYGACVSMAEFKSDPQLGYFKQMSDEWTGKLTRHLNLRRGYPGAFEFAQDAPFVFHDRATITSYWP